MTGDAHGEYERRIDRLEQRIDGHDRRINNLEANQAVHESRWADLRARHASAPAWVGIVISATIGLSGMAITLWLSGARP